MNEMSSVSCQTEKLACALALRRASCISREIGGAVSCTPSYSYFDRGGFSWSIGDVLRYLSIALSTLFVKSVDGEYLVADGNCCLREQAEEQIA
ncbi:hypothetical protein EVAR_3175_1 [Eumeta japonica]|uniref:Uncharacterized protein n=1 Tax=Eumeta variegata TaxID=151549 RepID=A0A4C1XH26_EUMVA|nr:hypothetical protein EVAR_3175_1 [Eumeta japonica]